MPLHLYLIRHGETTWSLTHQHTGRTDISLTEHGEEEARQLGKQLSGTRFGHVFSSPSRRAQRTCALVGLSQGAEIEPDLAEWDYGDYEGRTSADIRRERPDWSMFKDGCLNGESPDQVSDRADRLISRLSELCGNVALFSHGEFGRALAVRWIGLPFTTGLHLSFFTASLASLTVKADEPEIRVIELWNAGPALSAGPA